MDTSDRIAVQKMIEIETESLRKINASLKLSLRDQFAMNAMRAIIAELSFIHPKGIPMGSSGYHTDDVVPNYERIAKLSYAMADAMIKERDKI